MFPLLSLYNHFLGDGAFFARGDEEVDAVGSALHLVGVGAGGGVVVGLEVVDEGALHVVDLDVDFAGEVVEVELHLSVVGVGDDGEVGVSQFIKPVVGADHPVPLHDALVGSAAVEGMCGEPNGVFNAVEDVDLAALALGAEGFDDPVRSANAGPGDSVPVTVGVGIPEVEVVSVDLELGSGDDPVRGGVVGVHGIDGRGMWRVLELNSHGDEAVAVRCVRVGSVVGARHVVDKPVVVGVDDFMSHGVPEVLIAGLVFGDDEVVLVVAADGKVERGFAGAAEGVGVMVGVDGAFGKGHVNVEVVVLPAIGVAAGNHDLVAVVRPDFKVEDEGAVASVGVVEGVVIDAAFIVGDAVRGPRVFCSAEGNVVVLGVVLRLLNVEVDGAVAALMGFIVEDVGIRVGLVVLTREVVTRAALARGLPEVELVFRILEEVEPDDTVASVGRVEGVVVGARSADALTEEIVLLSLAEVVGDRGLVGLPVIEVEVDDGVAAELRV